MGVRARQAGGARRDADHPRKRRQAQQGKLVSGAGTNCKQLDAIIAIDKDALQFERNKLKELQASKDPAAKTQIKIVDEAEKAISKQIKKLVKRREVYVEEFFGLEGCDS